MAPGGIYGFFCFISFYVLKNYKIIIKINNKKSIAKLKSKKKLAFKL